MLSYETGDQQAARELLGRIVEANPQFSVLYSEEAGSVLEQLNSAARYGR